METQALTVTNGLPKPSRHEDEEVYDQLLQLRDVVLAGKHPEFRLPLSAIERIKAAIASSYVAAEGQQRIDTNAIAFQANLQRSHEVSENAGSITLSDSEGVHPLSISHQDPQLDPIFKEKSDTLVRAEGQLKRQRLERDLQAIADQRKHHSRDRDGGADGPSHINIDSVLSEALERVRPMSGLLTTAKSADTPASSFDENDYYSSQVQSEWSSDSNPHTASDQAAGAFTADFERLEGAAQAQPSSGLKAAPHSAASFPQHPTDNSKTYSREAQEVYEIEDDDDGDEYTPPDASAFDSFDGPREAPLEQQITSPDEDDDSEYEPGEITQDSTIPTPNDQARQSNQQSPQVPVIRNHLTHIAAPQPNRVSPLAIAKGPSIQLELINGRPELVQKTQPYIPQVTSRGSTASPSGNGNAATGNGKKRRNKKRKRESEPHARQKRRRDKQAVLRSPGVATSRGPRIKDEPISPPPFADVMNVPRYDDSPQYRSFGPVLPAPRRDQPPQWPVEASRSGLRHEYAQLASPQPFRVASSAAYRPVQRDTQDLRRVASLHHAQRPPSEARQRAYSPVGPYRVAAMTYGQPGTTNQSRIEDHRAPLLYDQQVGNDYAQTPRAERSPSPPRYTEDRDPFYGQPEKAAPMLPPTPPYRQMIVDQYGNRYYAAEPVPGPVPLPAPRASVAPYERAQSRVMNLRPPPYPASGHVHEGRGTGPVPTLPREALPAYGGSSTYRDQEYSTRPTEPYMYSETTTSPVYRPGQVYEQMPPPPVPEPSIVQERAPPAYLPRSYSVRPQEPPQVPSTYLRQASVAPVQYAHPDSQRPARAVSVMPGQEYGGSNHPQQYYAPVPYVPASQSVRYVDRYGNEVHPSGVRMVSEYR